MRRIYHSGMKTSVIPRKMRKANEKPTAAEKGRMDWFFSLVVLLLLIFGAAMSYSASHVYGEQARGNAYYYFFRHLCFSAIGIGAALLITQMMRREWLRPLAIFGYGGTLILLLLVLAVGATMGGAKRWLTLGPLSVQPSEFAKTALILLLALYYTVYQDRVHARNRWESIRYGLLFPGGLVALVGLLVAAEHHISGLMIIGAIGFSMMFLGGTKLRYLARIVLVILSAGVGLVLVSDYAQARVSTWVGMWTNPESLNMLGEAWQTMQGLYAIGSGGFFGLGFGCSRQKFGYVAQPQNDFIFTIVCEELGFLGALVVILLFGLLAWRGFLLASRADSRFSALVIAGLTFKTVFQAFLNMAVVTNLIPNTGISLPFFSYGGTSLVLQIAEMGLILYLSKGCTQK